MARMVSAGACGSAATSRRPALGLIVAALSGAPNALAADALVAVPFVFAIPGPGGAEVRIPVGAE